MLSIKEICAQTGITPQTFQSWRRDGSKLLPRPVAVKKNFIYFDDSILERVRFIRDQRAAGKKLGEIEAIFTSYYGLLSSWENDGLRAVSFHTVVEGLAADKAALKSKLDNLQAAFKRDLDNYERQIQGLFRDFQTALTEGNLSAFLAALSANRIGFIDQPRPSEIPVQEDKVLDCAIPESGEEGV